MKMREVLVFWGIPLSSRALQESRCGICLGVPTPETDVIATVEPHTPVYCKSHSQALINALQSGTRQDPIPGKAITFLHSPEGLVLSPSIIVRIQDEQYVVTYKDSQVVLPSIEQVLSYVYREYGISDTYPWLPSNASVCCFCQTDSLASFYQFLLRAGVNVRTPVFSEWLLLSGEQGNIPSYVWRQYQDYIAKASDLEPSAKNVA